jgi:hypothetical protein
VVQALVKKGADINVVHDDEVTPLGIATQLGSWQNAAVPVQDLGKMVARASFGAPAAPPHLAIEQGGHAGGEGAVQPEIARLMLA